MLVIAPSCHSSPPLSLPLSSPLSTTILTPILIPRPSSPVLVVTASCRLTAIPPLSSPPGPHHRCWSSRRRVIRPRLDPHRCPHPYPNLLTRPSSPVLVVAPSCHPSPPLSSPVSSPLSSPPGPHHRCWSSRRVIRPRFYPHRYPHRYPHPPALTPPVLVAIVPSCHSSPPLSSPLSSPPSSPLSSPPGPHHECSPPRRASTEDAPRRRIAQWSCLPGPPPVRCDHACRPACVFVVVAPREFGVAPRVLHARASKQATWKNTS